MSHSIATGAAGGQGPYARSSAHSTAAASNNPMQHNADHTSEKKSSTPRLSPAKAIAINCYAIAALLWGVSVYANIVGAFSPGAPPQGALLVAVLAVVAATGIVLVPVGKQYFIAEAGRGTRFVITAGNVFCLVLSCLLSYGTASSARLQGAGHNAEVIGRKQSAKQDEDDARTALKRYANTPATETLQARIEALKNTPGLVADCAGPQYSNVAREACKAIGELKARLGDARARDAAQAKLDLAQGRQLVMDDQVTRVDNMTKVVQSAASITGRTWTPERATDMASLVSVVAVEGLLSFFSMCGAAAWSSSVRRDLGRLGNTATPAGQSCEPDTSVTGDTECNSPTTVTNVVPMRTVAVNRPVRAVTAVNRAVTAPVTPVTPVTRLVIRSVTAAAPDHDEAAGALMAWLDTLASGEQVTVSQGELARQLGIAQQTVGRLLRLMQAQGMLTLHTDKRGTTVVKA